MTGFAHDLGARIEVLVNPMTEAHEAERVVCVLRLLDIFVDIRLVADFGKHVENGFVRPAMCGTPQAGNASGNTGEGIGTARAGETDRRGRGVLFVIGVQDKDLIHRLGDDRIDFVIFARRREQHVQEVFRKSKFVARIDERLSDRIFVRPAGNRRHLGDHPVGRHHALVGIGNIGAVMVEG